jgi:hypothetical protein
MDDADVVRRYMAEIEKVPPVTPAVEAELTRRARAGDDQVLPSLPIERTACVGCDAQD